MELTDAILQRRSYHSLEPTKITEDIIRDLAEAAKLAPSCFNNQPWRYVFVYDPEVLKKMHATLSKGNEWAIKGSMIIAVLGKKDDDCTMKDGREYFLFDIGIATGSLILKATDLGLVAHPIAGYDPDKVKNALNIPKDTQVITLLIIGKHSESINSELSGKQAGSEKERPERLPLQKFAFINTYSNKGVKK